MKRRKPGQQGNGNTGRQMNSSPKDGMQNFAMREGMISKKLIPEGPFSCSGNNGWRNSYILYKKQLVEDMVLKRIDPRMYKRIKHYIAQHRTEREAYVKRVISIIKQSPELSNIEFTVEARVKNFYSIYEKMKRTSKTLEEIYDLQGLRIICHTVPDCYCVLRQIHRLWPPVEGRCKDYIAYPKQTGYQSLHTTVSCFEGKLMEVQIRTRKMHLTAEFGSAAHNKVWGQRFS